MMDILSQKEIDALLNLMSSGEADTTELENKESVRKYDFQTANKFTKEHIRVVDATIKNFAHLLSNYFVGMLRTSCEIELLSIEEMTFSEFKNSVPSLSVVAVLCMAPLEGSAIFEISRETSCSIFSRVLGGAKTTTQERSQFTEIEMAIMERVIWQILKYYDEAWGKMIAVNSSLERLENNMQFAQVAEGNEAVLVATLDVQIGGEEGLMSFCLPRELISPLLKEISTNDLFNVASSGKRIEAKPEKAIHSLSCTFVNVSAVFNKTRAKTEDILRLQAGDVIKLNHTTKEPLTLMVQELPKYRGTFGKSNGNYAVKVQSEIKGDEQDG